jgi:hypothetical protein
MSNKRVSFLAFDGDYKPIGKGQLSFVRRIIPMPGFVARLKDIVSVEHEVVMDLLAIRFKRNYPVT